MHQNIEAEEEREVGREADDGSEIEEAGEDCCEEDEERPKAAELLYVSFEDALVDHHVAGLELVRSPGRCWSLAGEASFLIRFIAGCLRC